MLQHLTSGLVYLAAIISLVFVLRYLRTGWYKTEAGRDLMAFMAVISILLSLAIIKRLTSLSEIFWDQIRFVGLLHRLTLLFKYQRIGRKSRKDDVS